MGIGTRDQPVSVTVVNFKMGNTGSVVNMLRRLDVEAVVTGDPDEVSKASRIILPGVGSFAVAMANLKEMDLIEPLNERALQAKVPVFGLCLGMQLLASHSEEASNESGAPGLGWLPGRVVKMTPMENGNALPVPHIGWNTVKTTKPSRLFRDFEPDSRFYFVHSYQFVCDDTANELARTDYGGSFVAAVERENIAGVQFHPEKSHRAGMALLAQFLEV